MKRTRTALSTLALVLIVLMVTAWIPEFSPARTRASVVARGLASAPAATPAAQTLSRSASASASSPQAAILFPLARDAEVVPFSGASGATAFNTALSFEEVRAFYREALAREGGVERENLTLAGSGDGAWFSMVFDQWKPGQGQSVVIQGTLLSPGKHVISLRLETVP